MIMYERLRRLYITVREEERACQVLAAVGVHALCRSFDMFVEKKQGISNLELLYQQISRAEKAKELKREQKKLKKKMKKNEKKNGQRAFIDAGSDTAEADEEPDEAVELADMDYEIEVHHDNSEEIKEADAEAEEADDEIEHNTLDLANAEKQNSSTAVISKKKKKKKTKQQQKQNTNKGNTKKSNSNLMPQQQKQQQMQLDKKQSNTRSSSCTGSSISNSATEDSSKADYCSHSSSNLNAKCKDCLASMPNCPCDVKDSGYGSEANSSSNNVSCSSSSDGSEISCSDGFCNHHVHAIGSGAEDIENDHNQHHSCEKESCDFHNYQLNFLSLQQMLVSLAINANNAVKFMFVFMYVTNIFIFLF